MWDGHQEGGSAQRVFMSTSMKRGSPSGERTQTHAYKGTLGKYAGGAYLCGSQAPVSQELFRFQLPASGAFLAGALLLNILQQRFSEKNPAINLWKQVHRVGEEGFYNWMPSQLSTC